MRLHEQFQQLSGATRATRQSGRVISAASGVYLIRLDGGAQIRAEADVVYRVNQRVSVLDGRIVGTAGGSGTIKSVRG